MLAIIKLQSCQVFTKIGVTEEERAWPQQLLIDLKFSYDARLAAESDDVQYAIDYKSVWDTTREFSESHTFKLIETLATKISERLFAQFKIESLEITVNKPNALKAIGVENVGVSYSFTR